MTTEQATTTTAVPTMMTREKTALRLRHEWKHTINRLDDQVVTARLRKLFQHDTYADSRGTYRVSSLYFDTPYDKALRQKIDGVDRREKFRIRYYNEDLSLAEIAEHAGISRQGVRDSIIRSGRLPRGGGVRANI